MRSLDAALGVLFGLALGLGGAAVWIGRHTRRVWREQLELETRLRRVVVPVLERRADVLGVPPSERGVSVEGAVPLTLALAAAIKKQEESVDLPFGDTVEVARAELDRELESRPRRPEET